MKSIIKVKLKPAGTQISVMLPVGAVFMSAGFLPIGEVAALWFEAPSQAAFAENRVFQVVEDGYQMDDSSKYVGTVPTGEPKYNHLHVYELIELVKVPSA